MRNSFLYQYLARYERKKLKALTDNVTVSHHLYEYSHSNSYQLFALDSGSIARKIDRYAKHPIAQSVIDSDTTLCVMRETASSIRTGRYKKSFSELTPNRILAASINGIASIQVPDCSVFLQRFINSNLLSANNFPAVLMWVTADIFK
jgi:hypothetical protein